ncbi:MAG TPA: succinate dehydrogenase, cytochrome b556 subunit [Candidatus Binatia bacterium]|nr:succinate dehydrogenase, cytochrome b556 subunit [Candidatus Binatia bacterium]
MTDNPVAPPSAPPDTGRPLSPFMIPTYYRAQLTSTLSILHRATGVALTVGALGLVAWLLAVSAGPWQFASFARHLGTWYGQLALLGWSWALMYHLCNGIRHLFWDLGRGYDLRTVYRSGWTAVAVSFALTGAAWVMARLVP